MKQLSQNQALELAVNTLQNNGALKEIALDDPNRLIVYPVHLNPKVQEPVKRILKELTNIHAY